MESSLHRELKDRAYYYLWDKGYRILKKEVHCEWNFIDLWGMRYSDFYTMAVEVKVSRSDWRAGKKKEFYIDNGINPPAEENYILCPANLIMPEEVEDSIGLLWYKDGRLFNKKRAKFKMITVNKKLRILVRFLESKPF